MTRRWGRRAWDGGAIRLVGYQGSRTGGGSCSACEAGHLGGGGGGWLSCVSAYRAARNCGSLSMPLGLCSGASSPEHPALLYLVHSFRPSRLGSGGCQLREEAFLDHLTLH